MAHRPDCRARSVNDSVSGHASHLTLEGQLTSALGNFRNVCLRYRYRRQPHYGLTESANYVSNQDHPHSILNGLPILEQHARIADRHRESVRGIDHVVRAAGDLWRIVGNQQFTFNNQAVQTVQRLVAPDERGQLLIPGAGDIPLLFRPRISRWRLTTLLRICLGVGVHFRLINSVWDEAELRSTGSP